ncbi:hypothetical protein METHP14_10055 [Pseudomonas sp. P14-2025]
MSVFFYVNPARAGATGVLDIYQVRLPTFVETLYQRTSERTQKLGLENHSLAPTKKPTTRARKRRGNDGNRHAGTRKEH